MVDPVETAFSEDRSVDGPVGMVGHRLDDRRHQHRQGRTVALDGGERGLRREARMDGHGRAVMQRRRGLDVEAADMEERQHGQHMIVRGEAVHVLAHHAVPQQRLLPQHRALGPSRRAGGVDDQQRAGEVGMRIAAVAAGLRQQRDRMCSRAAAQNRARRRRVAAGFFPAQAESPAKACSSTSTLTAASDRMNSCSATASRQFSGTSMAPSRAQA